MNFSINKEEKYAVITLNETIYSNEITPLLKAEFIALNADGFCNMVLDLSTVETCDDAQVLSSLLFAERICKEASGLFVVCCAQKAVSDLIEIAELDRSLTVVGKLDEAIDLIFMGEIEKEIMGSFDEEN